MSAATPTNRRRSPYRPRFSFDDIRGSSSALRNAVRLARTAARGHAPVLLSGATGTGKELFASAIHVDGPRRSRPFLAINCAAIPRELFEAELFGHEAGAFTGANRAGAPGRFEQADGGTLFLDEVGELPLDLQPKLLRVLGTGEVYRVGAARPRAVDVRVVSATNRDLHREVERREFREDLFYRLATFTIALPSLRERLDDLQDLVTHFVGLLAPRILGVGASVAIAPRFLSGLAAHEWPGNIRELCAVIERELHHLEGPPWTLSHVPDSVSRGSAVRGGAADPARGRRDPVTDARAPIVPLRELERFAIERALAELGGSAERAARALGIGRATLYRKIREYDLTCAPSSAGAGAGSADRSSETSRPRGPRPRR